MCLTVCINFIIPLICKTKKIRGEIKKIYTILIAFYFILQMSEIPLIDNKVRETKFVSVKKCFFYNKGY